jgi:predicted NUDIX family NTP pyrophosphohydrolase
MPQHSAGILLYRRRQGAVEVLLVHPGGPFWAKKDDGAWSIPKGEYERGEDPLAAARREFQEETGAGAPEGTAIALGSFRQPSGKILCAWAIEGDFDPAALRSNTFSLEWPPRSGRRREVPEVDRAAWFTPEKAARKLLKGQRPILEALLRALGPGRWG